MVETGLAPGLQHESGNYGMTTRSAHAPRLAISGRVTGTRLSR